MKKCLAFGLVLLLIASVFSSCSVSVFKKKDNKADETTTDSTTVNVNLDSSDLPTITDADGNVVDYSVPEITNGAEEQTDNLADPYLTVGSLKDINNKAGTSIKVPTGVTVTNEEFDVNDSFSPKIACYSFMVDGKDYSIWASRSTGSMLMAIYLDDGTEVGGDFEGTEELAPTKVDNGYVARWFNDGVQYNLYANGVSESEFKAIYNKVK